MADRLKEIQAKVLGWWNKFTSRQKTIIVGIVAAVIFTFAILIYVVSRPQYSLLLNCETTADAAEVIAILDSAGISHREPNADGLRIEVESSQVSTANVAMGAAGYIPDDYSYDKMMSSSLSTTEADKQRAWKEYLQNRLSRDFQTFSQVKSANVFLTIPKQDGTLIRETQESTAYIRLELLEPLSTDNANAIARAAATALGNASTANITIIDTNANLLFYGEENTSSYGVTSSIIELRNQVASTLTGQVKSVILATGQFDMVEVVSQLDMDFSTSSQVERKYSLPDGRDDVGLIQQQDLYSSTHDSGAGGVPGTYSNDSNDGTGYVLPDSSNSSSAEDESSTSYLNNEAVTTSQNPAGTINKANSTIAISVIKYREIKEEDAQSQGLLDGITWEEYKENNKEDEKIEIDTDYYSMVSNATGFSENNISILGFERTLFYDKPGLAVDSTDILSVVMLVVILGLLAFVVVSSMRTRKVVEEEEELSVENLLQSTPETDLEDLEVESKSETRKMIEKFVDDNPEAAANLLRNWLTEEWG